MDILVRKKNDLVDFIWMENKRQAGYRKLRGCARLCIDVRRGET